MDLVRTLARPMLASTFVVGGYQTLQDPGPRARIAEDVARPLARSLPFRLPDDTEQLVRINAAVQVGAGTMLALGKAPRLSALLLAATLGPTTAAGHRFWEVDDGSSKSQQLIHFLKNVSMIGGLLIAAVDTGGRPSVPWLAGRAARQAGRLAAEGAGEAASRAQSGAAALAAALPVGP